MVTEVKAAEPLPIIFTSVEQRPSAVEKIAAAVELEAHGGTLVKIETQEQAALGAEFRAQVMKLIKELDTERLETTKGARDTVDRINKRFNDRIDGLKSKVGVIERAIKAWMDAVAARQRTERLAAEAAQREEQARREAEAKALNVEPPPPPPPVVMPPADNPYKIGGTYGSTTTTRDNWKWRVTDISKVEEAYLVPPDERIQKSVMNAKAKAAAKAAITALNLGPNDPVPTTLKDVVPGFELFNDVGLTSRTL